MQSSNVRVRAHFVDHEQAYRRRIERRRAIRGFGGGHMMLSRISLLIVGLMAIPTSLLAQTSRPNWVPLPMEIPKGIQKALPVGPKATTDMLHLSVAMPYRDPVGIQTFVDSVSNPKSPNYRHFLTPGQVGEMFGPTAATVKKVSDYLAGYGMQIRLVAGNRLSILADATVDQAQKAFNTSIEEFAPLNQPLAFGTKRFSFTTPPNLPAEISASIGYIGGLESFTKAIPRAQLAPNQLQTLYGIASAFKSGYTGKGRTIAISNFDGYRLSNVPLEYSQFGLPEPTGGAGSNITVKSIDGQNGNVSATHYEGDIDIQTTLAMAPLCSLIIYDNGDDSNPDLIGVLTQEANDNLADIVTESYGWSADVLFYASAHNIHLSMSAQGMTYMCASGDSGTSALEGVNASPYGDDDPEILTVGGTSVVTDSAGTRISEVGWNNSYGAGTGGWVISADSFNTLPSYQKGNGVPTNIPYRLVPDVALDADPNTGYQVFSSGQLQVFGGTSCASPTFAGALADCEQQIIAGGGLPANSVGKRRFGRIQDLLYSFNGDSHIFYDVIAGTNGTLPNGVTSEAGPGWDFVSGWGAMNFSGFVTRVLNVDPLSGISISATSLTGGMTTTGTVTLSAAAPSGGTIVDLSSNVSSVSVPSSVTIPGGATTADFSVTTYPVAAQSLATITATAGGVNVIAKLTVLAPTVLEFQVAPNSLTGGNGATGSIGISGAAPAGGFPITLSSSSSSVTVPGTVTIPNGASSATFTVSSKVVTASATVTLTASVLGVLTTTQITLKPVSLAEVTFSPSTVAGGVSSSGTVSLSGSAPTGGLILSLKSSTASVVVPATVKVGAGESSATFTATTKIVAASTTAEVTAKSGASSAIGSLTVRPPTLTGISVSPTPAIGGKTAVSGTVALSGSAPAAGITVLLSSSNSGVASVLASVKVLSGAKTAKFTVTTKPVSKTTPVTIQATFGGISQKASLTVQAPALVSVALSPTSVIGNSKTTVKGTVTIGSSAPAGGLVVNLASSNSTAATVPGSMTIAAGKTTGTFSVSHAAVSTQTPVAISASVGGTSKSATLVVKV